MEGWWVTPDLLPAGNPGWKITQKCLHKFYFIAKFEQVTICLSKLLLEQSLPTRKLCQFITKPLGSQHNTLPGITRSCFKALYIFNSYFSLTRFNAYNRTFYSTKVSNQWWVSNCSKEMRRGISFVILDAVCLKSNGWYFCKLLKKLEFQVIYPSG